MFRDIDKLLNANPGLTGREIAKRLGFDKKKVNSFLSRNGHLFNQDKDYKWFQSKNRTFVLSLPADAWITQEGFEDALSESGNPLDGTYKEAVITFPKNCSLMMVAIARMLSLLNQLSSRNLAVTIDLTKCKNTRTFLNRSGFFDLLDLKIIVLPCRPQPGNSDAVKYQDNSQSLVEFGAIDIGSTESEISKLIKRLGQRFVSEASNDYLPVIMTVFSELINNVKEHSNSRIPGFAALQSYNGRGRKKHIQTVISDSGLGVVATLRATLEGNYPKLHEKFPAGSLGSDIALVEYVFSNGRISRHGSKEGRGLGFESSRRQASKNEALLIIRQTYFSIELNYKDGELVSKNVKDNLSLINGTHICFDFFIDTPE
ncbi:ATP-binding protein [Cronobacter dublinensis]|uniref:ATP-binding protein n=1 Tax=Cronobacter dublinensis TaxID=413497 RepID=UPI000CFCB616|nr:ATP-binding protein [Cronobacter dublinensis]